MDNCRLIELTSHGDNRGSLIALEKEHDVPFDIKRVFYIYDTKRGTWIHWRYFMQKEVDEERELFLPGSF